VQLNSIFKTAAFRLALLYVLLFAASVAVLGVMAHSIISVALERRLDSRLAGEMSSLLADYRSSGLSALAAEAAARERIHRESPLSYLLVNNRGDRLAGHLPAMPAEQGWSTIEIRESNGDLGYLRVLSAAIADGRVAVAADREDIDEVRSAILTSLISAFATVVVLGIAGGIALSLAFLKRVGPIRRTAEAIIAGDLTRRVPVRGTGDDFDLLSFTLNRMLDRVAELMESLRQVSTDIAHDLKTPLTRLRQRLELARTDERSLPSEGSLVETTIETIDGILATFDALLRIAQIEAGTRRAGFRDFDLSELFATVVDAFAPSAEEAGKSLLGEIEPTIHISGDRELLTQMLANLVENAIRHTPAGTRIRVSLGREGQAIVAAVADNGHGVPLGERQRIFRRLYRLERSRSTPGSGLGLSLVKAVVDLHAISLDVLDAHPGLQIIMSFPNERGSIGKHPDSTPQGGTMPPDSARKAAPSKEPQSREAAEYRDLALGNSQRKPHVVAAVRAHDALAEACPSTAARGRGHVTLTAANIRKKSASLVAHLPRRLRLCTVALSTIRPAETPAIDFRRLADILLKLICVRCHALSLPSAAAPRLQFTDVLCDLRAGAAQP
jgi:signal transduction histidine kinase